MSKTVENIILFFVALLLQVILFNNIKLFNYINPYIYIYFIIYYPLKKEKGLFLFLSFLLGLSVDFFSDSGGINAATTLFIAYIRLPLLSTILRKSDFDYLLFRLRSIPFLKSLTYIFFLTFIHHLLLYSLEYFSFNEFKTILTKTFITSLFTVLLILLGIILFTKKR